MNRGAKVFIGLTVVFSFLGGPLILKLTPNTPSPVFFPTKISPNSGNEPITLFKVVAVTKVPPSFSPFEVSCDAISKS